MSAAEHTEPEMWGVIDLFGHTKIAGRIGEQTLGGSAFVRVDVPTVGDIAQHTRLFGHAAVYSISFTSREIAEAVARNIQSKPVSVYDFDHASRQRLAALPSPVAVKAPDSDDDGFFGEATEEFEDEDT
jgi:hypothetical protein